MNDPPRLEARADEPTDGMFRFAPLVGVLVAVDLQTRVLADWALAEETEVRDLGPIGLKLAHNPGVAFGLGSGYRPGSSSGR